MSNATGVKRKKKNHLSWIEKQEENKGALDCLTPNEYCLQKNEIIFDDAEILTSEVHNPYARTTGA